MPPNGVQWKYRALLLLGEDHEALRSRAFDGASWMGEAPGETIARIERFAKLLAEGGRTNAQVGIEPSLLSRP